MDAALDDVVLYQLLELVDALRVGCARERDDAKKVFAKRLK